jgi:hypothetical protein
MSKETCAGEASQTCLRFAYCLSLVVRRKPYFSTFLASIYCTPTLVAIETFSPNDICGDLMSGVSFKLCVNSPGGSIVELPELCCKVFIPFSVELTGDSEATCDDRCFLFGKSGVVLFDLFWPFSS